MGLKLGDGSVDPGGRVAVRGHVPRPVDHVEHLLGVGQRHDQRMVAPDAFVRNVHALLAFAQGRRHQAVDVEVGHRGQQVLPTPLPQLRPHRVDGLHQFDDVVGCEPAAEVPRRRRVGDQVGAQGVHVGRVVAPDLDVLQPGYRRTGRCRPDSARGPTRDRASAPSTGAGAGRSVSASPAWSPADDHPEAAIAGHVRAGADLVVHRSGGEQGLRLRRPVSGFLVQRLHLALAPCTVSATLLCRYSLHRKGLLRGGGESRLDAANSHYGKPFRPFRTDLQGTPCLFQG